MDGPVVFAIPSKGRLKEQVEAWLSDAGIGLILDGGGRGYTALLSGMDQIEVRLLSASDIAAALDSGEVHLGITGEDLLRERNGALKSRVELLRPLGFGRANLVTAVPRAWLDVDSMADLEEVAHLHLNRTGRRLRVATKYVVQTRAFFASHGVADYRIVESSGATEGAPAAGTAEVVVDITTTGATLAANHLKIVSDGVMLKSQAQLAAALSAQWSPGMLTVVRRLLGIVEGRARAGGLASLVWPADQDKAARLASEPFLKGGAQRRANGLLAEQAQLFEIAGSLGAAGIGPLTVSRPDYVFEPVCEAADALAARLGF